MAVNTIVKLLCNDKLKKIFCCPEILGKNFLICLELTSHPPQFSFQLFFLSEKKKGKNQTFSVQDDI